MLVSAVDGGLSAFWHLSGDDLIPASAGFGRDGAKPVPVLRLRRLQAGGATPVTEIILQLRGPSGQGERVFAVDARPGRYDAELGLSDASGGWVMLARSNVLDHGARVDVRLAPLERIKTPPDASIEAPAPAVSLLTDHPQPRSAAPLSSQAREQPNATPVVPEQIGIRAVDVVARRRAGLDPGLVPHREDRLFAGIPVRPDGAQPNRAYQSPSTLPDSDSEVQASRDAVSASQGEGAIPKPAHALEQRSSASPTAPMLYGQPTPGSTELLIEAELRVNGCAAPGSLIDLFGHPYRVGPGGRFQLVIRVDDPAVIKRALELNPPDLPDRPGDV